MKYLSICSGIEAATVAWHPLGWTPVGFGEIEKFPCQVLAHHYPDVTNFGDMTKFKEWSIGSDVNVLVGGTPCQSFSVAGLRKGLDDPRGNLMLTYLAIAAKHRPKWLVWENVPGVLSSNGGLDFASLLRGMGELGYGFAYRILDAQYFGVAQRRRRVFVVGYLGNWRPAAAVLFERHSLQGHPAPSREKGQGIAPTIKASVGTGGVDIEHPMVPVMHSCISPALKARDAKGPSSDGDGDGDGAILVPMMQPIALQDVRAVEKMQNGKGWNDDGTAYTVDTHATQGVAQPIPIDSMNHIGRGDKHSMGDFVSGAPSYTLTKHHSHAVAQPIAYTLSGGSDRGLHVNKAQVATCLDTHNAVGEFREQSQNAQTLIAQPIPFDTTQITSPQNGNNPKAGDPCHPLAAGAHPPAIAQPIAFSGQMSNPQTDVDMTQTLGAKNPMTVAQPIAFEPGKMKRLGYGDAEAGLAPTLRADAGDNQVAASVGMAVRRLTPVECERLQGFPDGYTDIQPKGKATPDGPRYKALGNSMAVPVMRWIGERIAQVEKINAP